MPPKPTATLPLTCTRAFPATLDNAGHARCYLSERLNGSPLTDDAVACLGELVNNAIIHSNSRFPGGIFTIRAAIGLTRLRVEVEDQGGPWEPRHTPSRDHDAGGRGLLIVSALATAWDIAPKTAAVRRLAWFEMETQ